MAAQLVTLAQAKTHLSVTDDAQNADIDLKLEQASAIILTYMKGQAVAGWSTGATAVPGNVQAAVLVVVEDLFEHRPINWDFVHGLLVTLRDPALA
jgi:hypothetical protein